MNDYLEEAATLLRKATVDNDGAWAHSELTRGEGRERIAKGFAQLAAIERGLIPAEMVGEIVASAVRSEVRR
jgi:hypothetical protein